MKIPANGSAILNIAAKLRNSYQLASIREQDITKQHLKPEKYNHLLIAKVKDTQIMFSFIVEASVIESTGNANNMSWAYLQVWVSINKARLLSEWLTGGND